MSDAGGKYTSTAFTTLMKEKGITVLQSVPHAHQQNSCAERLNQTLSDKAESLRLQACLLPSVRATLPPSTLFADRALLRRGYFISEPNALVETISKYKGLH